MKNDSKKIQSYFSRRAQFYEKLYNNQVGTLARYWWRYMPVYQQITLDALGNIKAKRILEVGCGVGQLAIELGKRGASVMAIDLCPEMIHIAQRKVDQFGLENRIQFQVLNFDSWNLMNLEKFDWIIAMTVFDYCPSPSRWLSVMSGAGDRVIATFPGRSPSQIPLRWMNGFINGGVSSRFYSQSEIFDLLGKGGFTVEQHYKLQSTHWVSASCKKFQ